MTEDVMKQRKICDDQFNEVADRLVNDAGIPLHLMLDRMFTLAIYQSCIHYGRDETVRQLRMMVDRTDAGMFNHLSGEPDKVSGNA